MAVDPVVEVVEKVEESVAATKEVEESVAATKEVEEGVVTTKDSSEEPKTPEKRSGEEEGCDRGEVPPSPDPYYPPIIYLPEVLLTLALSLILDLTPALRWWSTPARRRRRRRSSGARSCTGGGEGRPDCSIPVPRWL